jgi:hypothetical protein
MIQPTVGKRLWYWPTRATPDGAPYDLANQPSAATITHVNADGTVNISYLDRNGQPDRRITVPLWQRGRPRPIGAFCEYHPDDLAVLASINRAEMATVTPIFDPKEVIQSQGSSSRPMTLSLKKASEAKQ